VQKKIQQWFVVCVLMNMFDLISSRFLLPVLPCLKAIITFQTAMDAETAILIFNKEEFPEIKLDFHLRAKKYEKKEKGVMRGGNYHQGAKRIKNKNSNFKQSQMSMNCPIEHKCGEGGAKHMY
jgi:hypothetical protein